MIRLTTMLFSLLFLSPASAQNTQDLGWSQGFQEGDGPTITHLPFLWDLRNHSEKGDLILELDSGSATFLMMTLQNRKGKWSEVPLTWPLNPILEPGERRALSWERILKTLYEDASEEFRSPGILRIRVEVWGKGTTQTGGLILAKASLESRTGP